MLVAGEASGDEHGAMLVESLTALRPDVSVFGMGGSHLRAAGMETVIDSEQSAAVMGLTEVVGSLGKLLKAKKLLAELALRRKPDVVVLIDFPDFNMLLAKDLKKKGFTILYFITPQLWAWRRGRIKAIRRAVRKVAPIFPFEESFFQRAGVDAEYVGHPFLDRPELSLDRKSFCREHGIDQNQQILAMLPGSRKAEAGLLLKPMLDAFRLIKSARPDFQAVIPVAATLSRGWFEKQIEGIKDVRLVDGSAREILALARVSIVASGTATVEAALAERPFIAVYKLSPLTFSIARRLVRGVKNFAMANLIAAKKIVPELLQSEVTGERIALEIEKILGDPQLEQKMSRDLKLVRNKLEAGRKSHTSTAGRAAEIVIELAAEKEKPGIRLAREGTA